MSDQSDATAWLLIGHGTRDLRGQREFLETARRLAARLPDRRIEPAFLELAVPTIDEAVANLLPSRAGHRGTAWRGLRIVPLLLFAAGHAKQDIPQAVAAAARKIGFEGEITQAEHLGCETHLADLSALRFNEAMTTADPIDPQETMLLLVGRGSRDVSATAEMHQFLEKRVRLTPVGAAEVGFVAMAKPSLEETLRRLVQDRPRNIRRIVVQPHFLFAGQLLDRITKLVQQTAQIEERSESVESLPRRWVDSSGVEWIVAAQMGCHRLLAEAIVARATAN